MRAGALADPSAGDGGGGDSTAVGAPDQASSDPQITAPDPSAAPTDPTGVAPDAGVPTAPVAPGSAPTTPTVAPIPTHHRRGAIADTAAVPGTVAQILPTGRVAAPAEGPPAVRRLIWTTARAACPPRRTPRGCSPRPRTRAR